MKTDNEVKERLEICQECENMRKDKVGCNKLPKPCDLKFLLRCGDCPLGKWPKNEQSSV